VLSPNDTLNNNFLSHNHIGPAELLLMKESLEKNVQLQARIGMEF